MRRIGLLVSGITAAVASAFGALFAVRRRREQARQERRAARRASRVERQDASAAQAGALVAAPTVPAAKVVPAAAREETVPGGSSAAEPAEGELASVGEAAAEETPTAEGAATPAAHDHGVAHTAAEELRAIKGIGAVIAERLSEAGVTTLAQLAAWEDADIDEMAARLKVGAERIRHEDWVGQARTAMATHPAEGG